MQMNTLTPTTAPAPLSVTLCARRLAMPEHVQACVSAKEKRDMCAALLAPVLRHGGSAEQTAQLHAGLANAQAAFDAALSDSRAYRLGQARLTLKVWQRGPQGVRFLFILAAADSAAGWQGTPEATHEARMNELKTRLRSYAALWGSALSR